MSSLTATRDFFEGLDVTFRRPGADTGGVKFARNEIVIPLRIDWAHDYDGPSENMMSSLICLLQDHSLYKIYVTKVNTCNFLKI